MKHSTIGRLLRNLPRLFACRLKSGWSGSNPSDERLEAELKLRLGCNRAELGQGFRHMGKLLWRHTSERFPPLRDVGACRLVPDPGSLPEEFLFRGLFLQKYGAVFAVGAANVLQAMNFAVAHAGITYTPTALLFIVAVVFPLGLAAGYLTRVTNGVVVPAIFHAALDVAIYVAFLSYSP